MLRVQLNSNDHARLHPQYQQYQHHQQHQHHQHVALAPRPFLQHPEGTVTPSADMEDNDHSMMDDLPSSRIMIHRGKKMKGAPGAAGGAGRKMLKVEVNQLQHTVNNMQQQVNAATREIQELRNMVGLMVEQSHQHPKQDYEQVEELSPTHAHAPEALHVMGEETPVSCMVTPMMDIYNQQQDDFASFSPMFNDDSQTIADDNQEFYIKVEEFCDSYPLFFEN